jgi:hypothetical protein
VPTTSAIWLETGCDIWSKLPEGEALIGAKRKFPFNIISSSPFSFLVFLLTIPYPFFRPIPFPLFNLFMSDERILPLRNRAVRVAISPSPEADLPSTSTAMDSSGNDPIGPDPNASQAVLDRRVEAMERMLHELGLRLTATPSQPDSVPPVAPMS